MLVVHPLGELVGVLNVLLLLIAQLLELTADFLLLSLRLGLAQGLLHLLQFFAQVLLSLGEFLQPVECLEILALLGVLQFLRLPLSRVLVLGLLEFQLVELLLGAVALGFAGLAAALLRVAARHAMLVRLQLE